MGSAGAVKHDGGKLRFDLIPIYPLTELARVYTIGAVKYEDHNWRKGMRWGRLIAAAMRHLLRWCAGEKYDPEDGQHHLASVVWCMFSLMEYEREGIGEDDRGFKSEGGDVTEWFHPVDI